MFPSVLVLLFLLRCGTPAAAVCARSFRPTSRCWTSARFLWTASTFWHRLRRKCWSSTSGSEAGGVGERDKSRKPGDKLQSHEERTPSVRNCGKFNAAKPLPVRLHRWTGYCEWSDWGSVSHSSLLLFEVIQITQADHFCSPYDCDFRSQRSD